jgi:hypothetical protein
VILKNQNEMLNTKARRELLLRRRRTSTGRERQEISTAPYKNTLKEILLHLKI